MAAVHTHASHAERRPTRLSGSLRSRHVSMIAFGGIIGAGLFVGSGQIISGIGPAVVLSYLIAGLLSFAVMRMLASLGEQDPSTAAFARYAGRAFGWVGGFTVGWLYWWLMVVTIGVECSVATGIAHAWVPGISQWIWAVVLMGTFVGVNVLPVRVFGESQFWLVSIKVVMVVIVLLAGLLAAFGVLPGVSSPGVGNLLNHGGLLPHGLNSVLTGVLVAVFSFMGVEMIAVAAGEARTPGRTVRSSMRGVLPTITVLYVGSILIVVTMVPWDSSTTAQSPFAALFAALGVPNATQIVNALVFLAVLTVLNTCIYIASRLAYALASQGDAPRGMAKLSPAAVPKTAVIGTAVVAFATLAIQYVAPTGVTLVMEDSVGAIGLLVWLAIAGAYLRLRPVSQHAAYGSPQRTVGTYLAWVVIVVIVFMLIAMAILPSTRSQMLATLSVAVVIVVVALWRDTI